MNIRKLNIHSLLALDALIDEGSVSKAAKRCHVTQAAMSSTLNQLRDIFQDPLFTRESKGIRPTPLALSVHNKVKKALNSIDAIFQNDDFIPETSKREFHLTLNDHGEYIILPKLYRILEKKAPNVRLKITAYSENHNLNEILNSNIDLAIGVNTVNSNTLEKICLIDETAICVISKRNSMANQKLTLQRYLSNHHLAVDYTLQSTGSYIDKELALLKHQRIVKLRVQHITSALAVLEKTDLIGTFPTHLVCALAKRYQLVTKPVPFKVSHCPVYMHWHKHFTEDAAHVWLRNEIIRIVNQNDI